MTKELRCGTILIIEDDESILSTLKELLEAENYSVLTANNGQDGIKVLTTITHRPCLILLDMFMPIMDGWQFIDKLSQESKDIVAQIPIVITSAAGDRAKEAAKKVQGYIKKPYQLEQLLSVVEQYCSPGK